MTTIALENAVEQFTRETRAGFHGLYEVHKRALLGKLEAAGVLVEFPSDKGEEDYPFFKATPNLVEYDEGQLAITTFGHETYNLKNRLFGRGVAVPQIVFEDMGTNEAAKQAWLTRITGLATRAANFKHKMIADILLGEGLFATAALSQGWDATAMFATTHKSGSNLVNAAAGAATTFTTSDIETEHDLVMDLWTAQTDPDGNDFLREEAPDKLVVLVDPQHLRKYATVFRAQTIPSVREGTSTSDTGGVGMTSNVLSPASDDVMRGIDGVGRDIVLIGWARLRNKAKTIYMDASKQLPGPPPLFYQNRVAPQLQTLGLGSEFNIRYEKLLWKVRMRGTVGVGDFDKMIQVLKDGS